MSKQRVCHFSTVHRGVEIRIVRKELASLAAAGYDAHAVIAATPEEVAEAAALGITIHPLQDQPEAGRLSRMTRKMYNAWKTCRQVKADIYHFHDPELIPLGLFMKLCGHHIVMDIHEDLANQILTKHWIPARTRKLVAKAARTAERIGARFFDGVVTASPKQASFFQDVARPGRLTTLHNYPLLQELDLAPEIPAAHVDTSPSDDTASQADVPVARRPSTHVVYVGGISRIRGIIEAVKAIELADVQLILAGKFKTQAERDEAMALPGWKRVEDLGWVGRDGIRDALSRSFAGLCTLHPTPNHLNAEPIKLFEYMAAGIPSICATIPDWMPYVQKHDAGLCVDPMDVDAIAKAIRTLRDNPERAAEMGRNGRRAVIEHYNWETQAAKLRDLYQTILAT